MGGVMRFTYNDHSLKERRRNLRKNQTDAEALLWRKLRNKQINRIKFFRQYSVGPYILDFFCSEKRLAIELDGSQHLTNQEYDAERSYYLRSQDIKVLRFWNNEVISNLDGVFEKIFSELL